MARPPNDVSSEKTNVHPDWSQRIGVPKPGVNYWGCQRRQSDGSWQRLHFAADDGTHAFEWPLSELTLECIRSRWRSGEFRVSWHKFDDESFKPCGTGRTFILSEPQAVAAPPVEEPKPLSALPGLNDAMTLLSFADDRAAKQLGSILSAAAEIGRGGGGDHTAILQLIMQNSAQQAQLQHQQFMSELKEARAASERREELFRTELASLRRELTDDEDDSAVTSAVRAAAPLFRPGKPKGDAILTGILNAVADNPSIIGDVLGGIPKVIATLQAMKPPAPAPASAPAPQPERARPVAVLKPKGPPISGINAVLAAPVEASTAPPPAAEPARVEAPAAE